MFWALFWDTMHHATSFLQNSFVLDNRLLEKWLRIKYTICFFLVVSKVLKHKSLVVKSVH